jgi:hypothetical protein
LCAKAFGFHFTSAARLSVKPRRSDSSIEKGIARIPFFVKQLPALLRELAGERNLGASEGGYGFKASTVMAGLDLA